jgi:hypothetical protein
MSPQIQERLRCGDPGTDGFHARSLQPAACLGDTVMAMARGPDGRVATWEVTAWSAKMEHGTSYFIQFYQQIIKGKFSDANASIYWFAHPFFQHNISLSMIPGFFWLCATQLLQYQMRSVSTWSQGFAKNFKGERRIRWLVGDKLEILCWINQ